MGQEKLTKKKRASRTSVGKHGGGGKVRLTDLQKILLVNGGPAHRLRSNGKLGTIKLGGGKKRRED